jgi:hypothetical protein
MEEKNFRCAPHFLDQDGQRRFSLFLERRFHMANPRKRLSQPAHSQASCPHLP